MCENKSVLVGMSGGVDSSVTVGILQDAGYSVQGLTITPFKIDEKCKVEEGAKSCCNQKSMLDAMEIARKFGIEHYLVDMTGEFEKTIVKNFVDEYLAGRTPNPCVLCNPMIKWKALINKADSLGCRYVATGHYAKIRYDENLKKNVLCKAVDQNKDQTYFLWRLTSEELNRSLFPLGNLTKPETRQLAAKYELIVKDKPDSQEICFVPDNDYRHFLENYLKQSITNPGDFVLHGKPFGKHHGFANYTVGQRKGLGVSYSEPLYVKKIDAENNIIELDTIENISFKSLQANDVNLCKYTNLDSEKLYSVKIRYRDQGSLAKCKIQGGKLFVEFQKAKNSIAPGQSVVIYEGDDVVGGAVIESAE